MGLGACTSSAAGAAGYQPIDPPRPWTPDSDAGFSSRLPPSVRLLDACIAAVAVREAAAAAAARVRSERAERGAGMGFRAGAAARAAALASSAAATAAAASAAGAAAAIAAASSFRDAGFLEDTSASLRLHLPIAPPSDQRAQLPSSFDVDEALGASLALAAMSGREEAAGELTVVRAGRQRGWPGKSSAPSRQDGVEGAQQPLTARERGLSFTAAERRHAQGTLVLPQQLLLQYHSFQHPPSRAGAYSLASAAAPVDLAATGFFSASARALR